MKTFLTAAILGLTGLAGVASADAQDVRNYRNDRNTSKYEHRHHRREFRRHHAPRVQWTWVPARTESVFAGYDHCGKPIYQSVLVCEGHWTTRPICD